jgi:glycosyltransferase involved in cell wall biosynthesis
MRGLLIAPDQPWPFARHGAAQRTELLRRSLASICPTDLAVACIGEDEPAPAADHIVAVFREPAAPPPARRSLVERMFPLPALKRGIDGFYSTHSDLREWCRTQIDSGRYAFVVVRYLRTAAMSGLLERGIESPVFLDFDDVDWLKEAGRVAELELPLRWRMALARANRHREQLGRSLAARARGLWVASPAEQANLRPLASSVLPNIPFSLPEQVLAPRADARPTVLFVGLMNYAPNREGLDRFIIRSWPKVLATHSRARLRIVGKGLDEAHAARWRVVPGVELVGHVDDLEREYAQCHCTICPVHWGGGSNIKVLESIGHRRAGVVSTRVARQLHDWLPADHGVVEAADDASFADAVAELLAADASADAAVQRGQRVLQQRLCYEAFAATVRDDIGTALATQQAQAA